MPMLEQKKIERLFLPSTKDKTGDDAAWVDFDVSPTTAGSYLGIDDERIGSDRVGITLQVLANRIHDWNYVDVSGAKVPINFDTLKQLSEVDYKFLVENIPTDHNPLTTEQKKTSPAIS